MKYVIDQLWRLFLLLSIVLVAVLAVIVAWDFNNEYSLPERLMMVVVLWAALWQLEDLQK